MRAGHNDPPPAAGAAAAGAGGWWRLSCRRWRRRGQLYAKGRPSAQRLECLHALCVTNKMRTRRRGQHSLRHESIHPSIHAQLQLNPPTCSGIRNQEETLKTCRDSAGSSPRFPPPPLLMCLPAMSGYGGGGVLSQHSISSRPMHWICTCAVVGYWDPLLPPRPISKLEGSARELGRPSIGSSLNFDLIYRRARHCRPLGLPKDTGSPRIIAIASAMPYRMPTPCRAFRFTAPVSHHHTPKITQGPSSDGVSICIPASRGGGRWEDAALPPPERLHHLVVPPAGAGMCNGGFVGVRRGGSQPIG